MIGTQTPIPAFSALLYNTSRALGTAGEVEIARVLQSQGYEIATAHTKLRGDLIAFDKRGNALYIECKAARWSGAGYNFCLVKHKPNGATKTDHRGADFLIALCVTRLGLAVPFVFPIAAVSGIKKLLISGDPLNYAGKWSKYRQSLQAVKL